MSSINNSDCRNPISARNERLATEASITMTDAATPALDGQMKTTTTGRVELPALVCAAAAVATRTAAEQSLLFPRSHHHIFRTFFHIFFIARLSILVCSYPD